MKYAYLLNVLALIAAAIAGSVVIPGLHAQTTSQKTYITIFCADTDSAMTDTLNAQTEKGYRFEQAFYSALQRGDVLIFSISK